MLFRSKAQRDKIKSDAKYFVWDDPYLWKHCADQVIRRCILENEIISIFIFCHFYACGGQNVVSIGCLYFDIHIVSVSHVNIVKRQVIYSKGMRCHKPPYYFVKFFMFVALISWDHSLYLSIMFIFCLLLIMSQNGWKLNLPGQIILKLLQILSSLTYSPKLEIPKALISD